LRLLALRVFRSRPGRPARYETFEVEVPETAHLIDALEKIWATKDRTLSFRHACHHASCGTCGVRVNGVEKLACVTPVADYPEGKIITVEPLRNHPVVADLVVDPGTVFRPLHEVGLRIVREMEDDWPGADVRSFGADGEPAPDRLTRFEDCIECGLCVSACPVAGSDPLYSAPAVLAAVERITAEPRGADPERALAAARGEHGAWRCHGVFECSEVCPSSVHPADAIMRLRRRMITGKSTQPAGRAARRGFRRAPQGGPRRRERQRT